MSEITGTSLAKITGKGQITIPKGLRETLRFQDGDYVLLYPQGQGLRLEKASVSPLERFDKIAARTEANFEQQGITPETIAEAIRWTRESNE